MRHKLTKILLLTTSLIVATPSIAGKQNTQHQANYQNIISHPDRPKVDLIRDDSRLPLKLLQFMKIKTGMKIFEQGASGGYTTELLARAVGKTGEVFAEGLNAKRIAGGRLPQVKPLERGLIYQIPKRAAKAGLKNGEIDLVVFMFTYHDLTLNSRIDRSELLSNMKAMLKTGGSVILADNAAIEGSGLEYTRTLHRIDQKLVEQEFTNAGFTLTDSSDIYHNSKDDIKAHWRYLPNPRNHHRFLLRFTKP